MKEIIASVNGIVWGAPALLLILSVGLYLTWRLHFAQICFFPKALRQFCRQFLPNSKHEKDSSFRITIGFRRKAAFLIVKRRKKCWEGILETMTSSTIPMMRS